MPLLLLLLLQASPAARRDPALTAAGISVQLSAADGHVVRLGPAPTRTLAGTTTDSVGLWSIHLANRRLDAASARRFTWRRTTASSLELQWEDFADYPRLKVSAAVTTRRDSSLAWKLRAVGLRDLGAHAIHFPRLTGIRYPRTNPELAVPLWMGQRTRTPHKVLTTAAGEGRRLEWAYPGNMSLQLAALSDARTGGLAFSATDTFAWRKSFAMWGAPDSTAGFEMVHLPSDPGASDVWSMPYDAVVGTIPGDWFTAIARYRAWGTKQYWARFSRLSNGQSPEWLRNTGIWEWNRGRSANVLYPAELLQREAELPVSVFWHWWHNGPYDTSFPDYLPPREGAESFVNAVRSAHDVGIRAIVYMNQRLWCTNTPSWTRRNAERWAVRERDGRVRTEVYNIFDPLPCATMDISTPFWRDTYAAIADTVIQQYGIDGIYMDQAVLSLVCWSEDHGHPVGGGHYWMDGFRELATDLRRRKGERPTLFAGEGGGESWMPDLDAFLTLQVSQERYADPSSGWEPVPMFQAAYHPYAVTYGTYGSLTMPPYDELWPAATRPADALALLDRKFARQFYLEQARMFVWGMQPTIANFAEQQLTERRTEIDYLIRLARLRYAWREFFLDGVFERPPVVETTTSEILLSRVSIYAARRGGPTEARLTSPDVLSGAWRAADGRVALALASTREDSTVATLRLPARAYGLGPQTEIVRHGAGEPQRLGRLGAIARALRIPLKGLDGAVIELRPPARTR